MEKKKNKKNVQNNSLNDIHGREKTRVTVKNQEEDLEKIHLNPQQRKLYRTLMYGIKEFTSEELSKMTPLAIGQIVSNYQKATRVLHIMKAKKYYMHENNLINAIFPHAKIGQKDFDWLIELPKNATLKKLGISTKDVIDEFIRRKLLPKDFLSL